MKPNITYKIGDETKTHPCTVINFRTDGVIDGFGFDYYKNGNHQHGYFINYNGKYLLSVDGNVEAFLTF